MKKLLCLYTLVFAGYFLFSQEKTQTEARKVGYLYGFSVHNRGLSGNFSVYFGEKPTKWVIRLDAHTLKGSKETRIRSIWMDLKEGSRFVYDKMNRFGTITPSFGIRKAIIPASYYNKIAVTGEITTGFSIGLMRPYYLNIAVVDSTSPGLYSIKPTQWNPTDYTYVDVIGETNPFKELSPTKIYAGWAVRTAAYIDMSRRLGLIRGIQLNVDATFFPKKIPIMNTAPNTAIFTTVGLGLCFGNK